MSLLHSVKSRRLSYFDRKMNLVVVVDFVVFDKRYYWNLLSLN